MFERIGVVGLGRVGAALSRAFVEAEATVRGYNPFPGTGPRQ